MTNEQRQKLKDLEEQGNELGIMTISQYAKKHGLTYNGVTSNKSRQVVELWGVKFVVEV